MKKLIEIVTTFLCFNSVTPVLMYYIYDDNPTIGFVGLDNVVGEYVPEYNVPKKAITSPYGSRLQKTNSDRVIDSHFKLMKSPSRYGIPTLMDRSNVQRTNEDRITAPPSGWQGNNIPQVRSASKMQLQNTQQQQQKQPHQQQQHKQHLQQPHHQEQQIHPQTNNSPRAHHVKTPINDYNVDHRKSGNQQHVDKKVKDNNIQPIRPKAVNADYTSPMKSRPRSPDNTYDPKSNFVEMNVRKTQILQDPQKLVRLNNNIQLKAASVLGSQNERQRIPTSMIMDKTLHKSNGLNDRNIQAMSQVLNDIGQQVSERRHNKRENKGMDSKMLLNNNEKHKRSYVSENMKKYIGKDKPSPKELSSRKISSSVEIGKSLDPKQTPYALFYRLNPESVDQQEAFVLLRAVETNGYPNNSMKENHRSNEHMLGNASSKRTNNSAKILHKKKKLLNNFSSQK